MAGAPGVVPSQLPPGQDRRAREQARVPPRRVSHQARGQTAMIPRRSPVPLLTGVLAVVGCVGPISLHEAVLSYDQTVSRLERQMLLINIARLRAGLPVHFTVTSS